MQHDDHAGSGPFLAWSCGGKPFISNSALMKIIGSQKSIGIAPPLPHYPTGIGIDGQRWETAPPSATAHWNAPKSLTT
jgi:hypothetical protein